MNDTELERLAAGLGHRAAATLDSGKIAERVIARLDESRVIVSYRASAVRWLGGLAAAAMVVIALGLALKSNRPAANESVMHSSVLQELDGLTPDQLEQVLLSMPATASTLPQESAPLQELDTLSLKRLLRTLEG